MARKGRAIGKPSGAARDPREAPSEFYRYIEQGTWAAFSGENGIRGRANGRLNRLGFVSGAFDEFTVTPRELALALETPSVMALDVIEEVIKPPFAIGGVPFILFPTSLSEAESRISAARSDLPPFALRQTLMVWMTSGFDYLEEGAHPKSPDLFYARLGAIMPLDRRLALWCAASLIESLFKEKEVLELGIWARRPAWTFEVFTRACVKKVKAWISFGDESSRRKAMDAIVECETEAARVDDFIGSDRYFEMSSGERETDGDYSYARDFRGDLLPFRNFLRRAREVIMPPPEPLLRMSQKEIYEAESNNWKKTFFQIGSVAAKGAGEFLTVTLHAIEGFPAEPSRASGTLLGRVGIGKTVAVFAAGTALGAGAMYIARRP